VKEEYSDPSDYSSDTCSDFDWTSRSTAAAAVNGAAYGTSSSALNDARHGISTAAVSSFQLNKPPCRFAPCRLDADNILGR